MTAQLINFAVIAKFKSSIWVWKVAIERAFEKLNITNAASAGYLEGR
jgi:hypothetical protein